jgi:hypothetical protein
MQQWLMAKAANRLPVSKESAAAERRSSRGSEPLENAAARPPRALGAKRFEPEI